MRISTAALLALLALAACDSRPRGGTLTFERMRDQPRYDAYGHSTYFADGMAMRPLPAGTVARETRRSPTAAAAGPADFTLAAIPLPVDRAVLDHGRRAYDDFCRPCHGLDGTADTPVARSMRLRPPPSLLEPRVRALSVGSLFAVISQGYGLMPSYVRQLDPGDRWAVIAYVRALQLRADVLLATLPPPVRAEATQALEGQAGRE